MKYLLSVLFFFLLLPSSASAAIITGVQIPSEQTIARLVPSQYSFKWLKFQYSLGSSQPLEDWIKTAISLKAGGGANYKVLISVAKNLVGVETLENPIYPPLPYPEEYTHQYCPWEEELEEFPRTREVECNNPVDGTPTTCTEHYTVRATPKNDNGYVKFRDTMKDLAPLLSGVDHIEVWNEPNLAVEWSNQGLGEVNPENYANFLICGVKGLRRGGYTGKIISAGLAPLAPNDGKNMNDFTFFDKFIGFLSSKNQLGVIDAIGWHSNVTADLPPNNTSENGFQRVKHALGKGKPVWLTEFGWKRKDDSSEARQLQASYIAQAFDVAEKLKGIEAMFVWNFGFSKADPNNKEEFVLWDIEGTTPKGLLCQPNVAIDLKNRKERGDTKYVQDKSLTDDDFLSSVAAKALIPKIVNDDIASNSAKITETKIDVRESFLNNIPGILSFLRGPLVAIFNIQCGLSGIPLIGGSFTQYCTPTISVGSPEKLENGIAPGKNTGGLADKTKVLGQISAASGMELIPEKNDCNLGQLGLDNKDVGNEKLNTISSGLGTSAGFYGVDLPNFKKITPEDYEASMEARMKEENLNIGNKFFYEDRRSSDTYLQKQTMCKGFYPNGICPFEPTPTP